MFNEQLQKDLKEIRGSSPEYDRQGGQVRIRNQIKECLYKVNATHRNVDRMWLATKFQMTNKSFKLGLQLNSMLSSLDKVSD